MNDGTHDFLAAARNRYVEANRASLEWVLNRPRLRHGFLNTKFNPLSLTDYTVDDGWRGPDYLYGWMAGRGLESLVTHAAFFRSCDPELATALDAAARDLYTGLSALYGRYDGCFFCYDGNDMPVIRSADGQPAPQQIGTGYFTYSDAFALKGLIAAAARFEPGGLDFYLSRLTDLIRSIEQNRFIMDEWQPLTAETASNQPAEFGPRMILLGGASLLRRLALPDHAAFGHRFIQHVLTDHWDRPEPGHPASGLLVDATGGQASNPGHAIEFVGFALEFLPEDAPDRLIQDLESVLLASFRAGFHGPGICLSITTETGAPRSPNYPWWPLPETIRAAALCYARTRNSDVLDIWKQADQAFFADYRRPEHPIDYQTRTKDGPVDFVPATPDLDPGYHTGLSLMAAVEVAEALTE